MPIPTRQDALATLEQGHRAVHDLVGRLTVEQLERKGTMGGGEWSAKDLVGHLSLWEELSLQALAEWRQGMRPSVEAVFTSDDQVDRVNDEAVQRKGSLSAAEVLRQADDAHRRLVDVIDVISAEEWSAKAPYETARRSTLGALLGSIIGAPQRPFGHAFAHLPDLEAYVSALR